jgi:hypothetical protein
MTTKAITPLRQRMIEDMNARKLCAGTQGSRGVRIEKNATRRYISVSNRLGGGKPPTYRFLGVDSDV